METLSEKIYAIGSDEAEMLKIFNYGRCLHSVCDITFEHCVVDQYLLEFNSLL